MRKLKILAHISLDGVIEPDGPRDSEFAKGWTSPFRSPTGAATLADVQGKGFDLLLGRRTYDLWAGYWTTIKTGPFADGLNGATKFVVTHRSDGLSWGPVRQVSGDIVDGIRQLKSEGGPDLVTWGSTTITSLLLEQGLVDEVVLVVYPVLLGRGMRFFSDEADARQLSFVSTQTSPTGVHINTYQHIGSLRKRVSALNA